MIQIANEPHTDTKCTKCEKVFSTVQKLNCHIERKIPCDRIMKCAKCNKEFARLSHYNQHQKRKTTCAPIKGDPTVQISPLTCIYCIKAFKSKYSLTNHYNICKIKNGGMNLLFDEINRLSAENKEMKKELKKIQRTTTINIDNSRVINNHTNVELNINFVCANTFSDYVIEFLKEETIKLLTAKENENKPVGELATKFLTQMIASLHRNPERPTFQGIYANDTSDDANEAFVHFAHGWIKTNWCNARYGTVHTICDPLSADPEVKESDKREVIECAKGAANYMGITPNEIFKEEDIKYLNKTAGDILAFDTIHRE